MPKSKPVPQRSSWRTHLNHLKPQEDQVNTEVNVGQRLQDLRQARGLSQRALADLSGLNFNTLSLIENDKTSPNVSTLQQLANAMNVPMTAFFELTEVDRPELVWQRSGERQGIAFEQGVFSDLSGGMALGEGTPLLLTLEPHQDSGEAPLVHTGQEFVYCISGEILYWVEGKQFKLEPGDSLIFEAHLPHRWANHTDTPTLSLLVICPTDQADRMVSQHLPPDEEG